MKNNKIFILTIFFYFIIVGVFHFLRMALDWKIIIVSAQKDYPLSTLFSAFYFLFSVFVIYWIYSIKKKDKKIEIKNINKEEN